MPKTFLRPWPLFCAALLGGLLVVLVRSAATQQGDEKGPAAKKESPPGVFALLFVERHPPKVLDDGQKAPADPADPERYRRTQLALLRTRAVLIRALRDPAIAKLPVVQQQADPVAWLQKHLRAEYPDDTGVLRVSVSAGTPKEQAALANAVTSAYLAEGPDKEYEQRFKRLQELGGVYDKFDKILSEKRRKLRDMAEALGAANPKIVALQEEFAVTHLRTLNSELVQVRIQLLKAQAELAVLKEKGGDEAREQKIAVLKKLEDVLSREVDERTEKLKRSKRKGIDLQYLRDEISRDEEVVRSLGRQRQRLEVEMWAPRRVRLIQEAAAPN
jgi:hypothetical protein